MPTRILMAGLVVLLAGCRNLNDCRRQVGERDEKDIRVFLDLSGAEESQFCDSALLRAQYDQWAAKIAIESAAAEARRAVEDAESMAAASMAISASRPSR